MPTWLVVKEIEHNQKLITQIYIPFEQTILVGSAISFFSLIYDKNSLCEG